MKRLLLPLSVVIVAGLAVLLTASRGASNLASTNAKVTPLSGQPYDTQVDVVVKYNRPSLLPIPVPIPESIVGAASYGCKAWQVVDARGKPLQFKVSHMTMNHIGNYLYRFRFRFLLSKVPRSTGKLTLEAVVRLDDNILPIAVVVREP